MMNAESPAWLYEPKLASLVTKKPTTKPEKKTKQEPQLPIEQTTTTTPAGGSDADGGAPENALDVLKKIIVEQAQTTRSD